MTLTFTTLGRPRPQGSKRAIPTPNGVRLIEASKGLPQYRQALAHDAREAYLQLPDDLQAALHSRPLSLDVTFYLARPASHRRSGRFRDLLKPSAPTRPAVTPDTSKLARAAEDALMAAGAIRDDAQIVDLYARKRYAEGRDPECTVVEVRALAASVDAAEREALAA